MSGYLNTTIGEISDPDFQSLFKELCFCIAIREEEYIKQSLSFLLMTIVREKRALTMQHVPVARVLSMKVDKLSPESVIYCICRELANRASMNIECFDGKTVLCLIKRTHKFVCAAPPRTKALPRWRREYQFQTELIERRRRNGDL